MPIITHTMGVGFVSQARRHKARGRRGRQNARLACCTAEMSKIRSFMRRRELGTRWCAQARQISRSLPQTRWPLQNPCRQGTCLMSETMPAHEATLAAALVLPLPHIQPTSPPGRPCPLIARRAAASGLGERFQKHSRRRCCLCRGRWAEWWCCTWLSSGTCLALGWRSCCNVCFGHE